MRSTTIFTFFAVIAIICSIFAPRLFATGQPSPGTYLKITAGTPPADPAVVPVTVKSTASFSINLYDLDDHNKETAAATVQSQTYTIGVSGLATTIQAVNIDAAQRFLVTIASNKKSATLTKTGGNTGISIPVSVDVISTTAVNDTVTMSGSITLASGQVVTSNPSGSAKIAWENVFTIDYIINNKEIHVNPLTTTTLYVLKGTTATFHAVIAPAGNKTWPSYKPVWGGTASPTANTADAATATAMFANVTPQDPTTKKLTPLTVTAECGSTVSLNIVVYDIQTNYTPDIQFAQRATNKLGIMETATLSYTVAPTGLPLGGTAFKWQGTGVGSVNSITNKYAALAVAGNATISLQITAGPSSGQTTTPMPVTIVVPVRVTYSQVPGSNIEHVKNTAAIGVESYVYLSPNDVSFKNVGFTEGDCNPSVATGYYQQYANQAHLAGAQGWNFCSTTAGDINTGCMVLIGNAGHWDYAAWKATGGTFKNNAGSFVWPIPFQYSTDGRHYNPATAHTNEKFDLDNNVVLHVSKDQSKGQIAVSANGQNY